MGLDFRLRIVQRQWRILIELAPLLHGLTLRELADVTAMHERTVRRDVEALIAAGFAVEWRRAATDDGGRRIRLSVPLTKRRLVREALEALAVAGPIARSRDLRNRYGD